ncbi:hypothetical protein GGS21DRAFT_210276 [Xylaria nigripes]|nr:hypothetical protein GGS21DRAFT_210276 [Xylaria nigripes]
MHNHRGHVHSSRRVHPLTDNNIDHEIRLVDHDDSITPCHSQSSSLETDQSTHSIDLTTSRQPLTQSDSHAPLTQRASEDGRLSDERAPEVNSSRIPRIEEPPNDEIEPSNTDAAGSSSPQVHNGRQKSFSRSSINSRAAQGHPTTPKEPETDIDILYENQRGGFLCGIPLFSSAALGNLDPPAWTNFAHKPSPTDIHTAQVPDPSWQWAWPEWRVNHDEQIQTDGDGWEYSFMFSRTFSWHAPKWYNSFVRRRAWIRRRIKTHTGSHLLDEQIMNQPYFTIMPKKHEMSLIATAGDIEGISVDGQSRQSQEGSRTSRDRSRGRPEEASLPPEIKTIEDLMATLARLRIDREKLEAIENYIKNSTDDLLHLRDHMHQIMSIFVFQASRKTLLARLTHLHDDATIIVGKGKAAGTPRAENLAAAIKHADEEVRKLEYWSDIKGMAEKGEAVLAVDTDEGWDSGWQGLDKSGPKDINGEALPT